MLLVFFVIIVNVFIMNSGEAIEGAKLMQIEELLLCICAWRFLTIKSNKGKSVFAVLTWYYIFLYLSQNALEGVVDKYHSIELSALALISAFVYYKNYSKASDKINPNNVNLLFYKKQKTFKQTSLGLVAEPVASFGAIIGGLYQFRYGEDTIQCLRYDEDDIQSKYIVIDTGFPITNVTSEDIETLLNQKARQRKTLWLRFNCLRSFRHILNKIDGYAYEGEVFPSIYLRRIK